MPHGMSHGSRSSRALVNFHRPLASTLRFEITSSGEKPSFPCTMASNIRTEAGSMVLERPDSPNNRRTDGGNIQLMEARLTELYSSLRKLYSSNQELTEALSASPSDTDFSEALEENWSAMRKQRELALELVREMKNQGTNVDMPEDICDMKIPAWREPQKESQGAQQEEEKERTNEPDGGLYL